MQKNYLEELTEPEPYPADPYDDSRIIRGEVSPEEEAELERILQLMYVNRALEEGRKLVIVQDPASYDKLRESQEIFDSDNFYVLVDDEGVVQDMSPLLVRLIDTPEARFYAKIKLL